MKLSALPRKAKQDVLNVTGGLHSLNAPNAKGYVFCLMPDLQSIARGMFVSSDNEVTGKEWDWYYEYKTQELTRLPWDCVYTLDCTHLRMGCQSSNRPPAAGYTAGSSTGKANL
jgi:hypothetical protein